MSFFFSFFLICLSCPFQTLSMTKNVLFKFSRQFCVSFVSLLIFSFKYKSTPPFFLRCLIILWVNTGSFYMFACMHAWLVKSFYLFACLICQFAHAQLSKLFFPRDNLGQVSLFQFNTVWQLHGSVAVKKLLTAQFERDCGKSDELIFPNRYYGVATLLHNLFSEGA